MIDDILARWAHGWALSRDRALEPAGRAWRVEMADAYRDHETVIAAPTLAEVSAIAAEVGLTDRHWLSVLGEVSSESQRALDALVTVSRVETMMSATLSELASGSTATERAVQPEVRLTQAGDVAHAVITIDGVPAAHGQAALIGTDAIMDKIGTEPAFQRRGLARQIMAALGTWAIEGGATTGLLVASEQGRGLYTKLGWRTVAPLAIYRGHGAKA